MKSANTNAVMASTTGTARTAMQASCLPIASRLIASSPLASRLIASNVFLLDAVGLNTQRNVIGVPSLIPPAIPPETSVESPERYIWLPRSDTPPNPEPYSNPLQPFILIIAYAMCACNLSKIGSPTPTGTPVTVHRTIPPMLSPSSRTWRIYSSKSAGLVCSPT